MVKPTERKNSMKNNFNIGNLHIYLYDGDSDPKKNALYVMSYGTYIAWYDLERVTKGSKIGFDDSFYSQTTRYHQGIASQLLAYAIAGRWNYLRSALEWSDSLKKLRQFVGYSYGKKYVTIPENYN